MDKLQKKQAGLARRHRRVRGKISGTPARPRLCVTRSNSNMYVQLVDDVAHTTMCAVSTLGPDFKATGKNGATVEGAIALGEIEARVSERAAGRDNWVVGAGGDAAAGMVSHLHRRGLTGPLWEHLAR